MSQRICNFTIEKKYFKPEKAKELHNPELIQRGGIKMSCYDNLLFQVCPNPENEQLSQAIAGNIYSYVSVKTYYISREDFENENNWNQ